MPTEYNPENYWDNVAENINSRVDIKTIAGDDEPYYRYKRKLFLQWLNEIDFRDKSVLEVGSGPGGNLKYLSDRGCSEITGVDISSKMIEISRRLLTDTGIVVCKIDGTALPFPDNSFNVVFTSTVLQHITDEKNIKELVRNMCRVADDEVIIFERIEKKSKGHESNVGRPVEYYSLLFGENGFTLVEKDFLKIQASYYVCGAIRKVFNKRARKEGEAISKTAYFLQTITLPITRLMDKLVPSNRDLGMLRFRKMINNSI